MKKLLLVVAVSLLSQVHAGLQKNPNSVLRIVGSGNDFMTRQTTMSATQVGAVETAGFRDTIFYNGTDGAELAAGYWNDFYYNQSGAVTTAHGGAGFFRTHGNLGNQGFLFAVEGNTLCTSTSSTAYCGSLIAHTKGDTQASGVSFPITSLFYGVDSRIDITSDGFGTVPSATGFVVHFRPDPGSIGGFPGMRFGYYTTDTDLQILNAGNILKLSVSSAAVAGGTLDVSYACGGTLVLTSTGPITMSAASFTASSSNATNGTYNDGCQVTVMNLNLVANRTITFVHSLTGLNTTTAANIVTGALGGSFHMASVASVGVWNQTTIVTQGNR